MPQIIVTTGSARDPREGEVMLRERVNASDFESERFAVNLLERLGWAVGDATAVEERPEVWEPITDRELATEPELDPDPDPVGVA
jgi:hypothetical protein